MKYNELKMPTVKTSEIEDAVCKYLKYAHDKYVNDYDAMDTDIEHNSNAARGLTLLASISGLFVGISILFHFAGNAAFPNTHAFDINGAIFIAATILSYCCYLLKEKNRKSKGKIQSTREHYCTRIQAGCR